VSLKRTNAFLYGCAFVRMFDHRLHDILKENVPISRPLTSTWPHLRCDVCLEEGEYWKRMSLFYSIAYYDIGAHCTKVWAVVTCRSTVLGFWSCSV